MVFAFNKLLKIVIIRKLDIIFCVSIVSALRVESYYNITKILVHCYYYVITTNGRLLPLN